MQVRPAPATNVLKAFFALVAVGLFASTLAGVWMALKHNKAKGACWALLALGVAVPVVLTLLTV